MPSRSSWAARCGDLIAGRERGMVRRSSCGRCVARWASRSRALARSAARRCRACGRGRGRAVAGVDELLDLGDRDARGGGHHRVEVARGLSVDEVAEAVALPRFDDGEVGGERVLEDVAAPVELARLLAFGDHRAGAGRREEGGDAGAARADALGQRPLRAQLHLQLACRGTAARRSCSRRRSSTTIFLTWPFASRMPSPLSSTPQLFEMMVRPLVVPCVRMRARSGSPGCRTGRTRRPSGSPRRRGRRRPLPRRRRFCP